MQLWPWGDNGSGNREQGEIEDVLADAELPPLHGSAWVGFRMNRELENFLFPGSVHLFHMNNTAFYFMFLKGSTQGRSVHYRWNGLIVSPYKVCYCFSFTCVPHLLGSHDCA